LAVWLVPRDWRGLTTPVMRGADPRWRGLAISLLPRRSTGARQPHSAGRHLGRACDADRAQPRWRPSDDRGSNATELGSNPGQQRKLL